MTLAYSPTVRRVVRGQLCTGCGLCAGVSDGAIVMENAPPGYARPRQVGPVQPRGEQVIAAACPGAVVSPWPKTAKTDPVWGDWRQIGVGHAVDETLRYRASSGGAVTALAIHAMNMGLVRRVLHVAADPARPTANIIVCSETAADVAAGAGSRYASSSPLADIQRLLSEGGPCAFIGKPCDISAMRGLARLDPRVAVQAPLLLSFFCAGVPSANAADRLLTSMGVDPHEVQAFRYRGNGWPGNATASTRDGRSVEVSYEQSWGEYLSKEVQFRCKICPDAVGGVADIACADAWYGDDRGYPSFSEQQGRSLVVARTEVGDRLLGAAVDAGVMSFETLDIGQIDRMQPAQARRKRLVKSRLAALSLTLQPSIRAEGTYIDAAARKASLAEQGKSLLGSVRRILSGRR